MKQCSVCSELKSLSFFYHQRKICKKCYNESRKSRYNSDEKFRSKRAKQIQQYKIERESSDTEFYLKRRLSKRILETLLKQGESKILFKNYGIDVTSIFLKIGERPSTRHHLDHIFPVSAFDFTDPFQVWACNHKNNLQWLESEKNISKKDKYCKEKFSKYLVEMKFEWDASKT